MERAMQGLGVIVISHNLANVFDVADRIYRGDPNWVPPLLDDYRRSLDPKKSPFLKHGEIQ